MPKERPDETPQEEKGYTPASPVKRTLAWIGLAYALPVSYTHLTLPTKA